MYIIYDHNAIRIYAKCTKKSLLYIAFLKPYDVYDVCLKKIVFKQTICLSDFWSLENNHTNKQSFRLVNIGSFVYYCIDIFYFTYSRFVNQFT